MQSNDVLAVGKLVLVSVIVGAVIALAGQELVPVLAKIAGRWLGGG